MRVDFYGLWLEFSDFNQLQLKEIERGRLNGLSIAQVQTYAYSACPFSKMSIIRGAFEEGLSFSEVSIFAHLEFCEM